MNNPSAATEENGDRPIVLADNLLTGVGAIDDQHRNLANTLNQARQKLRNEPGWKLADQITYDLLAYALYHFETEESLMLQYGYDRECPTQYQAHLREHRRFADQAADYRSGLQRGQPVSIEQLLQFIQHWLLSHIQNTDKHLGNFIVSSLAH